MFLCRLWDLVNVYWWWQWQSIALQASLCHFCTDLVAESESRSFVEIRGLRTPRNLGSLVDGYFLSPTPAINLVTHGLLGSRRWGIRNVEQEVYTYWQNRITYANEFGKLSESYLVLMHVFLLYWNFNSRNISGESVIAKELCKDLQNANHSSPYYQAW